MVDQNVQTPSQAPSADPRSIPQLVADLAGDLSTLVRGEIQLVRAEIAEKGGRIARAGMEIGVGAVLMLVGVILLAQAIAIALAGWLGPVWSYALVGLALAALGGVALRTAQQTVKPEKLALERTARQIHETVQAVKDPSP